MNWSEHAGPWLKAGLKGIAQTVFCDKWLAGVLILAAIASLSIGSALAGAFGAAVGTVAGRLLKLRSFEDWREGLAGVNPAIIAIVWQGLYPLSGWGLLVLLGMIAICIAFDALFDRPFKRVGLPALCASSMATVFLVTVLQTLVDKTPWSGIVALGVAPAYLLLPAGLIFLALLLKSPRAAMLTLFLAAAASFVSARVYGTGLVGPVSLWAFAVAPTVFAVHGVFMAGANRGALVAFAATGLAVLLWAAWIYGPPGLVSPPLLIPFMLATWVGVALCRRLWGDESQNPLIWYVAEKIRRACARRDGVMVLTGAGVSTASGIPDYVSGAWIDPNEPASAFEFQRYMSSARCRRAYWKSCDRFLQVVRRSEPNPAHHAVASMEADGWITSVVTQNVDGLHQQGGSAKVYELHGRIDTIRCLSCSQLSTWPKAPVWKHYDLSCSLCGGVLKPAVIAMGEEIPRQMWQSCMRAAEHAGVVLVLGTELAVSSAAMLVRRAREAGALIVFVNLDRPTEPMEPRDVFIRGRIEDALPALATLLDCRVVRSKAPPPEVPAISPIASQT